LAAAAVASVSAGGAGVAVALAAERRLVGKAGGEKRVVYRLGSDYVFPRTVNLLVTHDLNTKDIKPTAEKYVPPARPRPLAAHDKPRPRKAQTRRSSSSCGLCLSIHSTARLKNDFALSLSPRRW
jgi:hypothetical protein